MNKFLIPVMIVAVFIAFYEQSKSDSNIYITIAAIVVFMLGMMKLSSKIPSKNSKKRR